MSESEVTVNQVSATNGVTLRSTAEACPPAMTFEQSASGFLELLRRLFSFPAMLGMILVGGVYLNAREFIVDPDCWWHIKTGQLILATHHWPHGDPYSYTVAGHPWLSYEWGGDVVLALFARWGGLRGLEAFLILVAGATLLALYGLATICAKNAKAGFVATIVLIALALPSFSLRPQMLGYLFLILTLIALERFRQGKRGALWFLPILFLVWVNTHGSWIIGLGTVVGYWFAGLFEFQLGSLEVRRWSQPDRVRLSFVFLLSLCALPITPYGIELCTYPFQVASSLPISVANIMEWQPMPFQMPGGKFFLALILGFIVLQVIFRFAWRLETLALFLFGTFMAVIHVRFILLFVPFSAPVLAVILARWVPAYNRAKDQFILNAVLMIVASVAMIYYFPSRAMLEDKVAANFPVGAVAYLDHHDVPGPLLNTYGFGGYLVWARGPEHKVFIDGRSELYEAGGLLNDYLQVLDIKPAGLAVLRFYGIKSLLLDRGEPLVTVLSALPEWQKVYFDNRSVIFVRREPAAPAADSKTSKPAGQE